MGVRLQSTFNDDYGTRWKIEIHDSDYSQTASDFTVGGDGFTLSYDGSADDLVDPIIGSSLEFTFYEENNTHQSALDVLSSAEEGRFTVKVIRDPDGTPEKWWMGVILPEMMSRPDVYWPRPTTITATCDLGNLKNVDFNDDGTSYTGTAPMTTILIDALKKVRTAEQHWGTSDVSDVFVSISKGIYADNQITADIIYNRVDRSLFRNPDDNGVPRYFNTYEVLRSLAVTYNARVFHAQGQFWFVPVSQYQTTVGQLTRNGYRINGGSATVSGSLTTNVNQGSTFKRLAGGNETLLPALKRVSRSMDTLAVHPIVADQDLDPYDSTTLTDDGRVYKENQLLVVGGKFVYNWAEGHSGTPPTNLFEQAALIEIRFKIKVGNKYLTRTATYGSSTNYNSATGTVIDYFLPTYGEDTWTTAEGYWPICWGEFINMYQSPVVRGDAFTFDFTVPEDLSGLELSLEIVGRDSGGSLDNTVIDGDGTTAPVIQFLDMAVYYGGDQVPTSVEFRATSERSSRHSIDQGTVLFGDTIGDVTLGELEVFTGSGWTTPGSWVVDGLEAQNAASSDFIHKVGVDEVLRMRVAPVPLWEATWRGSAEFYMWNTVFFDSTYYLPMSYKFVAQSGHHDLRLFKIARNNVLSDTELSDEHIVFNDDPRNSKGSGFGKPQTTLAGEALDRMRDVGATNGDVADVVADVAVNTTAIAANTSSIQTIQGDVSSANSAISTNTNNISTVDGNLTTLQKKIEGENLDKLGVFSDITDDTQGSVKVTTTSAILRAGNNTSIDATQTSPGSLAFKVQAGATGSEAEVTALQISGSSTVNTKATVNVTSGDFRVSSPSQFSEDVTFSGASKTITFTAGTSGIDYNDLDNLPASGTPLASADQTLTADRTIDGSGTNDLIVKNPSEFKITNSANATTFSVVPGSPGSVQVNGNFSVDSAQVTGGSIRLEEANLLGSNYIELKAPISITSNVTLTFPDGAGTSGQVLQTNGSGTLTWTDRLSQTNPLVKGALSIERITVGNTPKIYIKGEDNLAGVALQAPEAISTDVTFTLPESDGTNGQALVTNGSGSLSFATISGGSASPIFLAQIGGRYSWSSADDGERIWTGQGSYGPFNWYSFTSEPGNSTLRTYSASQAVDTATASINHWELIAYGVRVPTTDKKVKVHYAFRLQNAPASSTWGFSVWGADHDTSGNASTRTLTLRGETADVTHVSNSSTRVYHGTFTTASDFGEDFCMLLAENRSGALTTNTYMIANFTFELVD